MSSIKLSPNASGTGEFTIAAPNSNTNRTLTLPDATGTLVLSGGALGTPSSGNGSNLTNLNASNLATGTVGTARLGTGTADSTTFLRGDGTWASAGASTTYGAVGTYVIATIAVSPNTVSAENTTVSGSSLNRVTDPSNNTNRMSSLGNFTFASDFGYYFLDANDTNLGLTGTWRQLTRLRSSHQSVTYKMPALFVRIS